MVAKADGLLRISLHRLPRINKWPHLASQALLVPGTLTSREPGGWALPSGLEVRGRDEDYTGRGGGGGVKEQMWVICRRSCWLQMEYLNQRPAVTQEKEKQQLSPQIIFFHPHSLAYSFALCLPQVERPSHLFSLRGLHGTQLTPSLLSSAQNILVRQSKTGVTKITP